MRKLIVALFLLAVIATPSYAFNMIDKMIYKKDVLRGNNKPVMVNRLTKEVKYIQRSDGQWVEASGQWKEQYQKMYDGQYGNR